MKYFTFQVREPTRFKLLSVLLFVIILICTITAVVVVNNQDDKRLELVQVLFRHGERTPSELDYAVLKYTSKSVFEPYGLGQLTNVGKEQAYQFGKVLRERYGGYLSDMYNGEEVYAYSSENDRTRATLELVLAGLYPPRRQWLWNSELNWMPIPYRYAPAKLDVLLKPYNSQTYIKIRDRETDHLDREKKRTEYADVLKLLEEKAGVDLPKQNSEYLSRIFNNLHANERMNIPMPEWCTGDMLSRLTDYMAFVLDCYSYTPELNRLNGGTLIRKFLENMNLNGTLHNPRKIYLYSGHDLNLSAVTRAINVQNFRYPDYLSAIIFEKLRDADGRLFIRLIGRRGSAEELKTLKIGNCDELCPIEQFLRITQDFIPSDKEMNYLVDDFQGSVVDDLFLNDPYVTKR